jgi:hypothetical protein
VLKVVARPVATSEPKKMERVMFVMVWVRTFSPDYTQPSRASSNRFHTCGYWV